MMKKYFREQVRFLAEGILNNSIDLVDACRKLDSFRVSQNIDLKKDIDFLTIASIVSDTDEFPAGEMRKLCNKEYLLAMDNRLAVYLAVIKSDLIESCENLLRRFSENSKS